MKVICVTDRRLCRGDFLERIDGIARAGVDAVLLREKDWGKRLRGARRRPCLEICARHGTELILHTHAAVARRLGKLALHLPAAALFQDRETFRSFARVGVSVHSVEEALRARAWGADRLIAGHVFPTDCKPGLPPRGTEFLEGGLPCGRGAGLRHRRDRGRTDAGDPADGGGRRLRYVGVHDRRAGASASPTDISRGGAERAKNRPGVSEACGASRGRGRTMELTGDRLARYSPHILLREVGGEGQRKLFGARVLIVGIGGLGSPVALYLAAAGVGTIGLADADVVDLSNLQRQIIHATPDVGRPKVDSAASKIGALNPDVVVRPHRERLRADNIRAIIRNYDFVVDGTDDFAAKFLINDACVALGIPFSHGGISRFQGQTMTVLPGRSACYRCVFGAPPPEDSELACSRLGILGAVAGMLGTIQAAEALKYVTGIGEPLVDILLTFDARTMKFRRVPVKRNRGAPPCGAKDGFTEGAPASAVAIGAGGARSC